MAQWFDFMFIGSVLRVRREGSDSLAQFRQRVHGQFAQTRVGRFISNDGLAGCRRFVFPACGAQGIANRQEHRAAPIAASFVDLKFVHLDQRGPLEKARGVAGGLVEVNQWLASEPPVARLHLTQ